MRKGMKKIAKKAAASFLAAALCVTSFPSGIPGLDLTAKAATPADRPDKTIVYFVDCGDYVVDTVSAGDQLGTHNSVTDQVYGKDAATGYKWGIVDTISDPLKNGTSGCGGAFTDNTWPYEENTANTDVDKTKSNRYTKNQYEKGIAERYLDYQFELENGTYDVSVFCTDPWNCSEAPEVYVNYNKDSKIRIASGEEMSDNIINLKPATATVEVKDGDLTVNLRASSGDGVENRAINVCYILIKEHREKTEEEKEAEANQDETKVTNDYAALTLEGTQISDNISLPSKGVNGSEITWVSSNESVISSTGAVTRPKAGSADAKVTLTATIRSGEVSKEKKFNVVVLAQSDISDLSAFDLDKVEILDDYYNQAAKKDVDFLNTFDPDRLLYNFRLTAGYTADDISSQFDFDGDGKGATKSYSGWEDSQIAGHTLGHYLSAVAQAVANGYGDEVGADQKTISDRLNYLVESLADCQEKYGTGYIFGDKKTVSKTNMEIQFDIMEGKASGDTWVPWYTMHKILNGLVATYEYTGNTQALDVAEKLGEWVYQRTSTWTDQIKSRVLGKEYGGMNDCLFELYKCAKAAGYSDYDHFAAAGKKFDEDSLFEAVMKSDKINGSAKNVINGKHANCTIPKFIGALNHYLALNGEPGEDDAEKYLEYAEAFFDYVTTHHTYITGGNSECEFFGADDILDRERSNANNETCNTHNMLKFSRMLFLLTGDKKYADYYDTTFTNAIMASINEETGMTTYFQPMATGLWKVYCNPDVEKNYFWCCTGTGLENFTKLGDGFYYTSGTDKLIVNQYVSSEVTWAEGNIKLKQETKIPETDSAKFTVSLLNGKTSAKLDLRFRVPDWISGSAKITVNGTVVNVTESNGYVSVNREWKNNDVIEMTIPMTIRAYTLPDNPGVVYGFKYGPVVLAAQLGTDDKMTTHQIGVQCDVADYKIVNGQEMKLSGNYGGTSNLATLTTETLAVEGTSVSDYIENITEYLVKDDNALSFTLNGTDYDGTLNFVPYYRIHEQRYGVYWLFTGDDPAKVQENILNAKKTNRDQHVYLDGVGIGYGQQTEGNATTYPNMEETGNGSVGDMSALTRYAKAGGSFSYLFKVDKTKKNYLTCQYLKEDNGKTMIIKVGNAVIGTTKLDYAGSEEKYSVKYEIPADLVAQAETIDHTNATTGITEKRDVLRISFTGADGEDSARLSTSAYTSTEYSKNAGIKKVTSDIGTVTSKDDTFTITVPTTTGQVKVKAELEDTCGLLYMDGVLVNETQAKKIELSGQETTIQLKAYAEDHETSKDYTLKILKSDETPQQQTDSDPNPNPGPNSEQTTTALKSIALSSKTKSMVIGQTAILTVKFTPANATNKDVTFKVDKSSIVSVTQKGKITAKKNGKAVVTVVSKENSKIKATCTITVKKPSVTISGKTKVKKGKSIKLTAKVKNFKGTIKWSLDKKSKKLATLKAKGKTATLKAKKKTGTVTVTVKAGTVSKKKKIQIKKK